MDVLPIKLNFFKRAEQFLELRSLDKQYNLQIKKYDSKTAENQLPDSDVSINWPSWNVEKKILQWSYLNHKHLGSPIKVANLNTPKFQSDINTNNEEIKYVGANNILENLVAHGFADNHHLSGVVLNQNGLLAGSLISVIYKLEEKKMTKDLICKELIPIKYKELGFYFMYYSAWIIIFESILFLALQLISAIGLLDDLKLLFPKEILFYPIIFLILLPVILLLLGIFLISFPRIKFSEKFNLK